MQQALSAELLYIIAFPSISNGYVCIAEVALSLVQENEAIPIPLCFLSLMKYVPMPLLSFFTHYAVFVVKNTI